MFSRIAALVARYGRRRARCDQGGNQDRRDIPVQRSSVVDRPGWQGRGGLCAVDQRSRWHQRPQDQLHRNGRCLQSAESGRTRPQAGRKRRGIVHLRATRHARQFGDGEISQGQGRSIDRDRQWLQQIHRDRRLPADHDRPRQLPDRGKNLRQVPRQGLARRKICDSFPERRSRQGLRQRLQIVLEGRVRQACRHRSIRGDRADRRFPRSSISRARAPKRCSLPGHRNSPRRRSARLPRSAGRPRSSSTFRRARSAAR